MASVGQMTWFLCASYKRKEILKSITGDKDLLNELLEGVDCDVDIAVSLLKKGSDLTIQNFVKPDGLPGLMPCLH